MSKGQVHAFYEQLGHEAAARGEAELKDAHEAWIHGWTMGMEGQGKLEHLKKGVGDHRD
jgi:hypothetical protein